MIVLALWTASGGTDGHPQPARQNGNAGAHVWSLAQGVLRLDGEPLVTRVHGSVAAANGVLAMARLAKEPVHTELIVVIDGEAHVRAPAATPDRVALSPDGHQVAFVSGHTGWASVFVHDVATDRTRQLTNTEVVRVKGARPLGFTAPPLDAPVFDGCTLTWTTPETSVEVEWCR